MKPKTKLIIAIIIIAAVILVPAALCNAASKPIASASLYERTWKISIPYDFAEESHYTSDHGFQGDGWRYTVFKTQLKNTALSIQPACKPGEIAALTGNSVDSRDEDMERFVQETAAYLEVPGGNLPAFDELYLWKTLTKDDNDRLVILYFPDSDLIFFAEVLI